MEKVPKCLKWLFWILQIFTKLFDLNWSPNSKSGKEKQKKKIADVSNDVTVLNPRPKFSAVTAPPRSPPPCVPGLPRAALLKPTTLSLFPLCFPLGLHHQTAAKARRSSSLPPPHFFDSDEGSSLPRHLLASTCSSSPCAPPWTPSGFFCAAKSSKTRSTVRQRSRRDFVRFSAPSQDAPLVADLAIELLLPSRTSSTPLRA